MDQVILETQELRKEFGALVAVRDVNLQVGRNSIHSIIGPNGAGKTTLFNLLSGSYMPTSGRVVFKGQDITHLPTHRTAHLGIGRSYQITNLFPSLSVFENVRLAIQALSQHNFQFFRHFSKFARDVDRARAVLEQLGLQEQADQLVSSLPHGDQRKLELAMILAPDPELLLLDEPTAGLAAELVPEFMDLVRQVQQEGQKTVILVEHNMNVIMGISDRISVMHLGALLAEGSPREIAANETVQDAYLGKLYGDFQEVAKDH
jgi:branched-chain amino acid transport system ATP-binding protein